MPKYILLVLATLFFIFLYSFVDYTEYEYSLEEVIGSDVQGVTRASEAYITIPVSIVGFIKGLTLFFLMLLGILSNQIYELFKKKHEANQAVSLKPFWKEFITSARLWMAVFISPLLFFATYFVLKDTPDDIVAMFYSYQNGFFWYSLTSIIERGFTNAASISK